MKSETVLAKPGYMVTLGKELLSYPHALPIQALLKFLAVLRICKRHSTCSLLPTSLFTAQNLCGAVCYYHIPLGTLYEDQ